MPRTKSGPHRITQRVGTAVRAFRTDRGLTQQTLAERAGTHRTYLADVEGGRRNIAITNLARLLAAMDVKLSTFFAAIDRDPKP